jgi:hypothetical protein
LAEVERKIPGALRSIEDGMYTPALNTDEVRNFKCSRLGMLPEADGLSTWLGGLS